MRKLMTDGGAAFPYEGEYGVMQYGMSLRDWFAGQALMGMTAALLPQDLDKVLDGQIGGLRISKAAYMYADAMIDEQNRGRDDAERS